MSKLFKHSSHLNRMMLFVVVLAGLKLFGSSVCFLGYWLDVSWFACVQFLVTGVRFRCWFTCELLACVWYWLDCARY